MITLLMFDMTPVMILLFALHIAVGLLASAVIKRPWAILLGFLVSLVFGPEFLKWAAYFGLPTLVPLGILLYIRSYKPEHTGRRLENDDAWMCGCWGFAIIPLGFVVAGIAMILR